jgi:starch phosphorylase
MDDTPTLNPRTSAEPARSGLGVEALKRDIVTAWQDAPRWTRMSILNTAYAGKFSSDRAIREYCEQIWKIKPVKIALERRA